MTGGPLRRRRLKGARPDIVRRSYWRVKDSLLRAFEPKKGQKVRVTLPFGAEAELDLRFRNEWFLYRTIQEHRWYEPELSSLVLRLLHPGGSFVDGGANSGWYTLLAATRVGTQGRVWSVEPAPLSWQRLERNLALNPSLSSSVTPVHGALSDGRSPVVRIYHDPRQDTSDSLERTHLGGSVDIPAFRLQDLGVPPHALIKLDLEGHEYAAWDGWDHSVPATWCIEWEPALSDSVLKLEERLRGRRVWAILPAPSGFRLEEIQDEWPMDRVNLYIPEKNVPFAES